MHICLLTPSFPPMVDGGVAISTGRLVQCLLQRGHQITVVTTAPPEYLKQTTWSWPIGPPPPETGEGQGGGAVLNGRNMALHYGLVEDPLRTAPAVEALRVWAQAQHQREPFDVILGYFVYPAGYLAMVLGEVFGVSRSCAAVVGMT